MKRITIGTLVALALAGSACSGGDRSASPGDPRPVGDCVDSPELTAVDNRWKPACVIATSGDEITVTNEGSNRHILLMAGFEIYEAIDPGDDATVPVPHGLRAGARNEFRCAIHPSMVGYIYDVGLRQ